MHLFYNPTQILANVCVVNKDPQTSSNLLLKVVIFEMMKTTKYSIISQRSLTEHVAVGIISLK